MKKKPFLKFSFLILALAFVLVSCKNKSNGPVETIPTFTLSTSVSPTEGGSVSPQGGEYDEGSQIEISASANEGWIFREWNGDYSGTENPAAITMNQNMTVNALFEQLNYPLTIETEGEGTVDEQIVSSKMTEYAHGTMVELTAAPSADWRFVEWTGDLEGDENPATITIDEAKNVTAVFGFGFEEDFENGIADNWEFSDDRFSVQDGKLLFSTGNDDNWGSAYYNQMFKNFRIETRVTRTKSNASIESSMTLFIRSSGFLKRKDGVNGYEIAITQDGYGSVWKLADNEEMNIIPWVPVEQLEDDLGNYNVIAVNLNGSKFDIYINGEHIIGFSDDSFSEGYVGVATYASEEGNNEIMWDYVKISPPDAAKTIEYKKLDVNNSTGSSKGYKPER